MKRITITIKRPGQARQRITGLFASTTDAIVSMLSTLEESGAFSITAKVTP
jgi:hypothetical protein